MSVFEMADARLRGSARRAYEIGRLQGAMKRGLLAAMVATPSFLVCGQSSWAAACLAGFGLVVAAGWLRGQDYGDGVRAGALAGILPCLLPAALRVIDPTLCVMLSDRGPWICGIGGVAAGIVLGSSGRSRGATFWVAALAALAFPACLGCLPAGEFGFVGLAIGLIGGGAPALGARRASA